MTVLPMVNPRPSPASRHETRATTASCGSICWPGHRRRPRRVRDRTETLNEFLTLVRLHDRWQIIAKVFHYELAEEA